mmetsp:Transcript_44865/g.65939  ORF Transcript_44865/g.65939 Transcript_44865/m.65939 type:complete len:283 (-) Transcript_44865:116-964(-)
MNPSLMPCFSVNSSLCLDLISIRLPISTSWNVVSIAAVFWASLRRTPTRCLIRDIFVLVSVLDPDDSAGAAAGGEGAFCGLTAGAGGAAAGEAAGSEVRSIGVAGAAPTSFTTLSETTSSEEAPAPCAATAGSAEGAASVSIWNKLLPTSTTSSSSPIISTKFPASGERTSTLTLSVSRTTTTSSASTYVPGSTGKSTIVPSVILSPIVGTSTIFTGIATLRVEVRYDRVILISVEIPRNSLLRVEEDDETENVRADARALKVRANRQTPRREAAEKLIIIF